MVIKTNKTGKLCPKCHKFGINENGICDYCGHDTTQRCPFPWLENEGCLCDECYYNSGIDHYCPRADFVAEKVAKVTGKIYNFIYDGHEYTHRDNSMDFESCVDCGKKHGTLLGYYGSGQGRIACFECRQCFKKYYYHSPE